MKKALPELIYYIILYMQITEDQVCNALRSVLSSPARSTYSRFGLHWCRDSDATLSSSDQSLDGQPSAVRGGRGRRHLLVLRQDLRAGPVAGEVETICLKYPGSLTWFYSRVIPGAGAQNSVRSPTFCLQAVAAEFQNESAAALAAAATRHLQEAEQAKNSGDEHWWDRKHCF